MHEHKAVPHVRSDTAATLLQPERTTATRVDARPTFGVVVRVAGFHPGLLKQVARAVGQVLPASLIQFLRVERGVCSLPAPSFLARHIDFHTAVLLGNNRFEDRQAVVLQRMPADVHDNHARNFVAKGVAELTRIGKRDSRFVARIRALRFPCGTTESIFCFSFAQAAVKAS